MFRVFNLNTKQTQRYEIIKEERYEKERYEKKRYETIKEERYEKERYEKEREKEREKKQKEQEELNRLEELNKKSIEFDDKYSQEMFSESWGTDGEMKYYLQHIFNEFKNFLINMYLKNITQDNYFYVKYNSTFDYYKYSLRFNYLNQFKGGNSFDNNRDEICFLNDKIQNYFKKKFLEKGYILEFIINEYERLDMNLYHDIYHIKCNLYKKEIKEEINL